MKAILSGAVVMLLASGVEAGVRRGAVVRRLVASPARIAAAPVRPAAKVTLERPLAVVPFAVPVAVPVAEFDPTGVFYGVHEFATARDARPSSNAHQEETVNSTESLSAGEVLRRHCAACHTGEEAAGKLTMFDAAGSLVEKLPRHVMWEMVTPAADGTSRMPPAERPRLNAAELEALREWARLPRDLRY